MVLVAGTQNGGWMQRLKDQGKDPSKPLFSTSVSDTAETNIGAPAPAPSVSMISPEVNQKFTIDEL
ncbi:hypothetical protein C0995_005984, partial [Termitomyces sp. Mi166